MCRNTTEMIGSIAAEGKWLKMAKKQLSQGRYQMTIQHHNRSPQGCWKYHPPEIIEFCSQPASENTIPE